MLSGEKLNTIEIAGIKYNERIAFEEVVRALVITRRSDLLLKG